VEFYFYEMPNRAHGEIKAKPYLYFGTGILFVLVSDLQAITQSQPLFRQKVVLDLILLKLLN